jgi:hypothetical protein
VLLEVGGDAAGHLMQISSLGEGGGQVVQLPGRQQLQGAGDLDLRRIPQQHHHQVAVPAAAAVQPPTAASGGLLVAELASVGHRVTSP